MKQRFNLHIKYLLAFFSLTFFLIVLAIQNYSLNKKLELESNNIIQSKVTNDNFKSHKTKILEHNMNYSLENNEIELKNIKLNCLDGKNKSFKELVNSSSNVKLILRISDMFCNTCNEYMLLKLERIKNEIGIDNIIIIGSYQNKNSLSILKNNFKLPFQVYNTENKNAFNYLPIENEHFPYCFIVDKSMHIQHLFLPNKAEPGITDAFFKTITKRYFSK